MVVLINQTPDVNCRTACYRLSTLEDAIKSSDIDAAVESLLARQLPLRHKNNKSVEDHFPKYLERLEQVMESLAEATATVSKLQGVISKSRCCAAEHRQLLEKLARHELPAGKVDYLMATASKQGHSLQLLKKANMLLMKVKQTAEQMMRRVDVPAAAQSPYNSNLGLQKSTAESKTEMSASMRSSVW
mmetsp:Transcript_25141/g.43407  ORF Transcript_25141/g.43407 Transcript_25141/m.43407 type:complete len:188 (-) Transcript_25141:1097-1660(-)